MKVKAIRRTIFVCTLIITMSSFFLIMGLALGFVKPLWLALVVGGNAIVLFINAAFLYVLNIDKTWWDTKDRLEEHIETYKRKCMAYERAREDLIQVQLKYHYDGAKDKYDETLKNLAD